jgi:hypothetical protein
MKIRPIKVLSASAMSEQAQVRELKATSVQLMPIRHIKLNQRNSRTHSGKQVARSPTASWRSASPTPC